MIFSSPPDQRRPACDAFGFQAIPATVNLRGSVPPGLSDRTLAFSAAVAVACGRMEERVRRSCLDQANRVQCLALPVLRLGRESSATRYFQLIAGNPSAQLWLPPQSRRGDITPKNAVGRSQGLLWRTIRTLKTSWTLRSTGNPRLRGSVPNFVPTLPFFKGSVSGSG